MTSKLSAALRRRLPPSLRRFNQGVRDIVSALNELRYDPDHGLARIQAETGEIRATVERLREGVPQLERATESLAVLESRLHVLEQSADRQERALNEGLWADVFNNTVSTSTWLKDTAFSPGRWAAGYPYLYVLYRVLEEVRPRRILELGLGQSTRMIAQYAASHEDVKHTVIEHDEEWIAFFSRSFRLPENVNVLKLSWEYVSYRGENVRTYSGFEDALRGQQFDLISIDGPLGGDMHAFARIDVLGLMPLCLRPSFVVLMDDYERSGEAQTMSEMRSVLHSAGVEHRHALYSGSKDVGLLCSPDLGFLCSM